MARARSRLYTSQSSKESMQLSPLQTTSNGTLVTPKLTLVFLPRPSRKSANRAMAFEFALHRNGQPIFTSTFASSSPSTLSLQLDNSIFFPAWVTGIATAVRLTRKGVRFFPRERPHRLGSESPVSSRLIPTIDSFQRDSAANCHYITRFIGKSSLHL